MKAAIPIIFYLFLFGCVVLMYFHKDSGHEQSLIEKDKAYQRTLDSLQVKIDSIQKEKVAWMRFVTDSEQRANKLENEARVWKQRYEKETRNRRHFNDADTDSLISAIR